MTIVSAGTITQKPFAGDIILPDQTKRLMAVFMYVSLILVKFPFTSSDVKV